MCDNLPVLLRQPSSSTRDDATFHRTVFGALTITALCDGHFPLCAHDVLRSGDTPLGDLLEDAHLDAVVPSHVNAFLVDDGTHRTLIDTGAGHLQDATLGRMTLQLMAAGYDPHDIDIVLLTHLHPDHMGGLTHHGEAVFSRATVHVPRDESEFWLDNGEPADVDGSVRATFEHARRTLAPYLREGRYRPFEPGTTWLGYISAEPLPGHTCGHTGYRVRTDAGDIVFCGDLFHVAAVQLVTPGVTVCYDSDPMRAHATRKAFLNAMARRGDIVGAAHAPFPGLGRIRNDGAGYAWEPCVE
ncbi:MAG: hypothetical protein GAK28_04421 [Luteibacter sp.]|uniref:MBL fold metallo-hydrolase n=1 Tax=Luteibacter sp. TaxID=1886636 RepID=UPI00137E9C88|nr:MBL fold metallo-hydrolase [Luteibacter sp.]KAF1003767.1 MAG: hypothetical protein GAK28_04421 [Luteibacter sp.]